MWRMELRGTLGRKFWPRVQATCARDPIRQTQKEGPHWIFNLLYMFKFRVNLEHIKHMLIHQCLDIEPRPSL